MFTSIFNQERNVSKLERFIAEYYDIPYEKVHNNLKLIPRKLPKDITHEAYKEVDLLLHLDNSLLKINFEINNDISKGRINRNVIYISKVSGSNYESGDQTYSKIKTSRQININDKYKSDIFIDEYLFRNKEGMVLSNIIQIDVINITLIDKLDYNSLNKKEKMVYNLCMLLKTTDVGEFERLSELLMEYDDSKDLVNQVKQMSNEDEYVTLESDYSAQELYFNTLKDDIIAEEQEKALEMQKEALEKGMKEGIEKGKEQGIQQGIEQTLKNNAIMFHNNGVSEEIIMKSLNITHEKLSEYLNNKS